MSHLMFFQAAAAIARQWPWFWPAVGGLFGAVLGSFLNCARWRVPRGISLRQPPSMCPSCRTTLRVPDLVPVLSYVVLRGKCRYCGVSIGSASLWVELACTAAAVLLSIGIQAHLLGH